MNENVGQSVFRLKRETGQKIRDLARKTRAPMSEVLEERSAEDDTAYTLEET